MAALLYLGDYVAIGMLLKRSSGNNEDALLQEWIQLVAQPMMNRDTAQVLEGLQHVSTTSPPPFQHYAGEIGAMYIQRQQQQQENNTPTRGSSMSPAMMGPVVAFLETTQWSG